MSQAAVANEAYCAKLEEVMATDPSELGYGFTCWTIERLIAHLAKVTGSTMSDEPFGQLLDEHADGYRRPKPDLKPLQDASARATAKTLIDDLKKGRKRERSTDSLCTKPR